MDELTSSSIKAKEDEIVQEFKNASSAYGPVPFWWWHGEPLEKERLKWQLKQLKDKGVSGTVINYQHDSNMETATGDPEIFSQPWWELWDEIVEECEKLGLTIGFSDYTLTWPDKGPVAKNLLSKHPDLRGTKVDYVSTTVSNKEKSTISLPTDATWIEVKAYQTNKEEKLNPDVTIDLLERNTQNRISWIPEDNGTWKIIGVYIIEEGFDPTHPSLGKKTIEDYYEPFVNKHPDKRKKVLNYFFQDEVSFIMSGMPYWSERLKNEFHRLKGYDIQANIVALWFNIGPSTPKIRLDYFDVVVTLMEEGYFRPIYEWFEKNDMRMGCDQEARGHVEKGVNVYGDYFRILRWFAAPGSDDPGAGKRRNLIRAKIHSSIAELYDRPRVWLEGYHSSGWGVTPSQLTAFTNENFVYGYNLLNLHGLYYTTYAGWWEWAPPDFHFRQPYWEHMNIFNKYVTRLSYLLSQGVRINDIAILYPTSSVQAGYHPDETEIMMHNIGTSLFESKLDFDFIDDESIQKADIVDGKLRIGQKNYKVLVLPMMSALRSETWNQIYNLHEDGGFVLSYGCTPIASDVYGEGDKNFLREVENVFSHSANGSFEENGKVIKDDLSLVKQWITEKIGFDFFCNEEDVYYQHRKIGNDHLYMIYNSGEPKRLEASFPCFGELERWDSWSGEIFSIQSTHREDHLTTTTLDMEKNEAQILLFKNNKSTNSSNNKTQTPKNYSEVIEFSNQWDIHYKQVLNNTWGDFQFPRSNETLGPQIRQFKYSEEKPAINDWKSPEYDDSDWELHTYSFGPKFWKLGPFPSNETVQELEKELKNINDIQDIKASASALELSTYSYSETLGIENDPQHRYWLAGPHGLKQNVPDEFIDLGNGLGNDEGFYHSAHVDVPEKTIGNVTPPGSIWYLWSKVYSEQTQTKYLHFNAVTYTSVYPIIEEKLPCTLWINGGEVANYSGSYAVTLEKGINNILIKLVQSEQDISHFNDRSFPGRLRIRAYAAFVDSKTADDTEKNLYLKWPEYQGYLPFNIHTQQKSVTGYFRFQAPPGLKSMFINCLGTIKEIWIDGKAAAIEKLESNRTDTQKYKVQPDKPRTNVSTIALKMEQSPPHYGGAAIPEPIRLEVTTGKGCLGDWSNLALQSYSGLVVYSKKIDLDKKLADKYSYLDLTEVATTTKVIINSQEVDTLITEPWSVDVSRYLQPGKNKIEVEVANTLANHYSIGIPSMYVYPGQTKSGLFGPVKLHFY